MKFRKKPVVIEAVQYNGFNAADIFDFIGCSRAACTVGVGHPIEIKTLEGVMTASLNDWIIKGVSGEYYPCKPDIFEQTYERVEE